MNDGIRISWRPALINWLEAAQATEPQRKALRLYTTLCCLDFLSETGLQFNKDQPEPVDEKRVERLVSLLDELVSPVSESHF